MRVIAGRARGYPLRSVRDRSVRPTPDRVREALFSILGDRVKDRPFLDLYAGSGAVGIEALSRGASEVTFVEKSRAAIAVIHSNLSRCGFEGGGRVIGADVVDLLRRGELAEESFAVAYIDPPYESTEGALVLRELERTPPAVAETELIVFEHRRKAPPPETAGFLVRTRTAFYGDTALSFYQRAGLF